MSWPITSLTINFSVCLLCVYQQDVSRGMLLPTAVMILVIYFFLAALQPEQYNNATPANYNSDVYNVMSMHRFAHTNYIFHLTPL